MAARKTNVYLAVKNPAVLVENSARKLIAKIKARFNTSIFFWRCMLLIYAGILTVPLYCYLAPLWSHLNRGLMEP
ncbi:hypothetical protein, partial [Propionivibrio sp.]|uniref:hypothetical protein n=1 Tax=Propionivibrio sp. TaxID=2212460 RepID=UPI003BF3847E